MPRISYPTDEHFDGDFDVDFIEDSRSDKRQREKPATQNAPCTTRPARRPDGTEEFKCGHCRAFIGPTVSGGKFRNHCPICLYSRHVDRSRPGDRASDCRSLMQPIGMMSRPNGEQMTAHRCLGCGAERRHRVAADDNMVPCMRLEPLASPPPAWKGDEERIA